MKKLIGLFIIFLSSGLCANAQSAFDKKITAAVAQLTSNEPTNENPVTLNARILLEKDSIAIIVKVGMAPGWHIYQYVPSTMPYIAIEHILKLPEGFQSVGKWEISKPFPSSNDPGVLIYEKQAWFVHKVVRSAGIRSNEIIQTGLYYQTCDLHQCLPPVEKIIELKVEPES